VNKSVRSNKLKILFVIDGLQFGGGERVFAQLINGLSIEKYELFLACKPNKVLYQAIRNKSVKTIPLDFSKQFNPHLIFKLTRLINKNNIDIVHGQGTRAEFYARVATRLTGKAKYVATIAMPVEGFDVSPFKKRIYRFFDRLSEKYVDRFIVVSDVLKNKLVQDRGIPSEKVVRIYNGIEVNEYSPQNLNKYRDKIRKEFNLNNSDVLIGAIGRLVWQKGFEYLIQAIPQLQRRFPDVKVLIVGEGPLRKQLEALSRELGVQDQIILTGFRNDIKEILCTIDILLIPSLLEGFPMIILEAMAMARPIIATEIDGITEQILDNKTGFLIPPQDSNSISKTLINLILDDELCNKIGLNAREITQNEFSLSKMLTQTNEVYQSLSLSKYS